MHRFHGIWLDLDGDDFGGFSAERLFGLIERLAAYDGVVTARVVEAQEMAKRQNPSRAVLEKPDSSEQELSPAALAAELGGEYVEV